jgi:uncharacterized membrane protein
VAIEIGDQARLKCNSPEESMVITNLFALKLFAIIGCAIIAGAFFAFSTFIMSALSRLPPAQGIAAMQSINITVINPLFMTVLFGTAAACAWLAIVALSKLPQIDAVYVLVGSLLYLIGAIGVTIAFNIPLNEALAKVAPDSNEGSNLWTRYLSEWTWWNHVRTLAALLASILLLLAKPLV